MYLNAVSINDRYWSKLNLYFSDLFGFDTKGVEKAYIMPISPEDMPTFSCDAKRQLQLFVPEGFIDVREFDYADVLERGFRKYHFRTELAKKMLESSEAFFEGACLLEEHLGKQLKSYEVDEDGLLEYFALIKDYVLARDNKASDFYHAEAMYEAYLEQRNVTRLLLLVFLSLMLCQKYEKNMVYYLCGAEYNYTNDKYDKYEQAFRLIWFDKAGITGLLNKYAECAEADKIDKLYLSCPQDIKNDGEFKLLIAREFLACGEYNSSMLYLKEVSGNPEAYALLADFYSGKYSEEFIDSDERDRCIDKAKRAGNCDLILSEIKQLGNNLYEKRRLSRLLSYINNRLSKEKATPESLMSGADLSDYYYYKACSLDNDNLKDEAQRLFEKALETGNENARAKIKKNSRTILEYKKSFSGECRSGICVVNSANSEALSLLLTLPESYAVFSIACDFEKTGVSGAYNYDNAGDCIDEVIDCYRQYEMPVLVALLSDDENVNLNNCLEFLDRLFNEAVSVGEEDGSLKLNKLIESFDIYMRGNYEYASTFLDASLSDMGEGIYFKTHIIDSNKSSVLNLLYEKPLFIPCLDGAEEVRACVCGFDNDFNISVAREIMGVGYIGEKNPIGISLLTNNHIELKEKMQSAFPGMYNKLRGAITPKIADCDFTEAQLLSRLNEDKKINYIIVNIGSDIENIRFAVTLRRHLLVNSEGLDRRPFIAVYCKDPKTAFLANRMTLDNVKAEEHYYNNYDLYFFGMVNSLYSYEGIIDNRLNKQALAVHLSYAKKYKTEPHIARKDFYSYQYNQDSSVNTAICLRYRLYVAGCYDGRIADKAFTLEEDSSDACLNKYRAGLCADIEEYACNEQIRWNNFMLSRGWLAPTMEQLRLYLKNPKISNHKYMLAKLHPYIADWDDLDDNGDICRTIRESNKKFSPPREITTDSVKETTEWLSIFREKEAER